MDSEKQFRSDVFPDLMECSEKEKRKEKKRKEKKKEKEKERKKERKEGGIKNVQK